MEKKIYELMVVLPQDATQKKAEELVKSLLAKGGGKVMTVDFWGKKQLVYPIKKQMQGVYVCFDLELGLKEVLELQKRIKLEEGLLRHLLVIKKNQVKEEKSPKKAKSKKK